MSASELQVAYQADDDGTGKIIATVKSGVILGSRERRGYLIPTT